VVQRWLIYCRRPTTGPLPQSSPPDHEARTGRPAPIVAGPKMHRGAFANQKELIDYAEAHDLAHAFEGSGSFAKQRLAQQAQAGQHVLVEVQTSRKLTKALLFPRAILRAEAEADRSFREARAIKRERLAVNEQKRANKLRDSYSPKHRGSMHRRRYSHVPTR